MKFRDSRAKKYAGINNLRRIVQAVFLVAFAVIFFLTIGRYDAVSQKLAVASRIPADIFFRLDPLLVLARIISTRYIVYSALLYPLIIVGLTIVAGRFFCGWICPMGSLLDVSDHVFYRKRQAKAVSIRFRRIKYYLLTAILISAVFSSQIAYLLDPFAILTRAFTLAVFPAVDLTAKSLGSIGFVNDYLPWLSHNTIIPADVNYFFRFNFVAAFMLIAIIAANAISRRFWCRNLCPLGAMLGVLSRFSLVRRMVGKECIHCGKCAADCKMGAVNSDFVSYKSAECVNCFSCTAICPVTTTAIIPSTSTIGYEPRLDLPRRRLLQGAGIGAMMAVLAKTNVSAKNARSGYPKISSDTLIRPPGSLPEDDFVNACVRCSECMKICPTGGLQPSIVESGFAGIATPVLVPRIGECSQNCNLCSQVCPSGAITPFEVAEKKSIYLGTAVIDRSVCMVWNAGKQCLVCDEYCSYRAVYWQDVDGVRRPMVNENMCVGCGICENACPVQPKAAIRVSSFGDKRHLSRQEQAVIYSHAEKGKSKSDFTYP